MPANKLLLSRYAHDNNVFALGVHGDEAFIEEQRNFLVNYGCIIYYAKFHRIGSHFGYFVVDKARLALAYGDEIRYKFIGQKHIYGETYTSQDYADDKLRYWFANRGLEVVNKIEREDFMKGRMNETHEYSFSDYTRRFAHSNLS